MKNVGGQLRALREGAKLSQAKVAQYAGTNQPSVNRYENGHTAPPLDILMWYAEFFDVSLDYIFGRTGKPQGALYGAEPRAEAKGGKPAIVRDIIMESVRAHPDLTAYMYKRARTEPYQHLTYRETADEIYALGAQLVEMGLKGKRVAVIGDNCYHWAAAYFAVLFGVGVVVPLDKELRPEEIKNLLKVAECSAIFHTERYDDVLADVDFVPFKIRMNIYTDTPNPEGALTCKGLIESGKRLSKEKVDAFKATKIDENALAALLFTSGTTGNAKGVMLANRGMGANIHDMAAAHNAKPGGATVSILPMHHCFEAVMGQQFMLANGVAVAFGDGLKYIQKNMEEVQPTIMLFVPLLLENLYNKIMAAVIEQGGEFDLRRRVNDYLKLRAELGPADDSKARLIAREMFKGEQAIFGGRLDSIFTGAAAINPRVIQGLQEIGIKITYGYGMTECGPLMTTTPYFSDTMGKSGSVGPATPSGAMRIAEPDEKGIGEICYKGPTVMLGLYSRPDETAEVMRGEWFRSGDFGMMDDDGWLYITGREANIIVTKTGKNVFPEELEAELGLHPYIEELMVYESEDKKRGGALISAQIRPDYAAIAKAAGEETAADEEKALELLRTAVAEFNAGIANYKRIRHIMIRSEEFVKTPTKKIMRSRNV
ncbi:MAG: AMP-binding protein [Clostridiales Family XIII bacterium]|jgi:long-chain acyl-CoA synthetase|nr:AMP-binding protein [Clostridiales Family XIII bacterium]